MKRSDQTLNDWKRDSMIRILYAALCIWVIFGCNRSADRPAELSPADSTPYQRVSMNYEIQGTQDTCLVFIHGWNLNMRYWDDQVRHFQQRFRILNLDLAGHGNSGKDRSHWTIENFARDIAQIMEKENVTNAVLVGHSVGANIALHVQEMQPDRVIRIIAVDSFKDVGFELTDDFRNGFRDHFAKFKRNYAQMADDYARQNTRSKNREVINRIVNDYRSANAKIALAVYSQVIQKHAEEKDRLSRLPFQLYVINSDYTPIDEDALARYARFGYEIIPVYGAGHFPMVEEPDQLNIALDSALRVP